MAKGHLTPKTTFPITRIFVEVRESSPYQVVPQNTQIDTKYIVPIFPSLTFRPEVLGNYITQNSQSTR